MNLQNLLEHSETSIQLLKQIKIADKTGVDTVPAYLQHVASYNKNYNFIVFGSLALINKTKKSWLPISILIKDNLLNKATGRTGVKNNVNIMYTKEIADIMTAFFQSPVEIFENTEMLDNFNMFEFYVHLPKLAPWFKWINDDTTRPILRKAAWQQGQKDNYQFQQEPQ